MRLGAGLGELDLFCIQRKYLVLNMVSRNLKIKYRRSLFGFLWTLLIPLSQALVYYSVFNVILKVQMPNYLVLILCGVLPWTFLSQTVLEGIDALVSNSAILTKVPVPLQLFSLTGSLTNLFTLALSTPVILGSMILSGVEINPSILFLPYLWACLFMIAYGFALALGIIFIYLRDLKHIFGIVIQLWFYGTPVLYHEKMIPEEYRWILSLNPVGELFVGIHQICFESRVPSITQFLAPLIWSLIALLLAVVSLKFLSKRAVESL